MRGRGWALGAGKHGLPASLLPWGEGVYLPQLGFPEPKNKKASTRRPCPVTLQNRGFSQVTEGGNAKNQF